jgi:MEDS: MEthanogen/methylotroph, DcmR Sensory domain
MAGLHRRLFSYAADAARPEEPVTSSHETTKDRRVVLTQTSADIESHPPIVQEAHQHHAVQFYDDEKTLYATVAGFLGQGLVDEQPAILIATAAHCGPILDELKGRMLDVDHAQGSGDLIVLDAEETLAQFMRDDVPSADAFESTVGDLIRRLLVKRSKPTLIRAYGEMVDVLWKDGKSDAAIRLEILWNRLADRFGFALLCGYSMGHFYKQTDRFEDVCRQHAHVVPPRPLRRQPPNYA